MSTIFRVTIKEIVRRKILHVTIILSVIFLALYGFGLHFAYINLNSNLSGNLDPIRAMIIPQFFALGLFFGCFLISFLTIMTAVGAISSEIENGTSLAILSRPVRRSEIILGKFSGYAVVLCVFSLIFYVVSLLLAAVLTHTHVSLHPISLVLFTLQPLILLAVTLYGTTLLPTMANGIAVFMLYAVGWLGGMIEQIGGLLQNQTLLHLGIVSSLLMPADALYRKIIATSQSSYVLALSGHALGPFGVNSEPSVWMLVYTGVYIVFFLFIAIRRFNRRDI